MVLHPLKTLVDSGITEICVVLGGNNIGKFVQFLGDGSEYGANIYFRHQGKALGIAHAINCCKDFIGADKFCVILGDNIFNKSFKKEVDEFVNSDYTCMLFTVESDTPERFGVLTYKINRAIYPDKTPHRIVEKPQTYMGNQIVVGIYFYDSHFFEYFKEIKASGRGEFEITDINNKYLNYKSTIVKAYNGFWSDAGTIETLLYTNQKIGVI